MSKLDNFKDQLRKLGETIRESEAFQQLKAKYDELDAQTKVYVNLGAIASVFLFISLTVLIGISRLNGMKSAINEREELIGYLQRSADTIKQMKAQQQAQRGSGDTNSPLPEFLENTLQSSGIDRAKAQVGTEKNGTEDKEVREILVDVKLSQINLKQLTRFLFTITEQGTARHLNIKDLLVDTKEDASGFMEAQVTIASYKAK